MRLPGLLLCCALSLAGAEPTAEAYANAGFAAMKAAEADPDRLIDAAAAFAKALEAYRAGGDADKVCEMQASLYWCRKRMNVDRAKAYLAAKGDEKAAHALLANVQALADRPVPAAQADDYLARAKRFAAEHPDDHLPQAIRFFEVADRFAGTPVGVEAQRLSLDAQQRHLAALSAAGIRLGSPFERAITPAAGTLPPTERLVAAQAGARATYAKDLLERNKYQRRVFAQRLLATAAATPDDPALRIVLRELAAEAAVAIEDWALALAAIDGNRAEFGSYDHHQALRNALRPVAAQPVPGAVLTLLEHPEDAPANALVGRWWCASGRWKEGCALLLRGNDSAAKACAERDLALPAALADIEATAEGWVTLAKAEKDERQRTAWALRGLGWYRTGVRLATGGTAERLQGLIDGLVEQYPAGADLDHLTPRQWDRLKGTVLTVANGAVTEVRPTLAPGVRRRLVPHPVDHWTATVASGEDLAVGAAGTTRWFAVPDQPPFAALVLRKDGGPWTAPGIIIGPGRFELAGHLPYGGTLTGKLRVKLIDPGEGD